MVVYARDASGRITSVATRKVSSDPWSDVLTSIVYQPQSRLIQSATFANSLNDWNTYTQDYELNASGASVREYIWLLEAEIAPTAASRAPIDRPIAAVDGVGGGSPTLYYVHTDHLNRPIKMSDAAMAQHEGPCRPTFVAASGCAAGKTCFDDASPCTAQ